MAPAMATKRLRIELIKLQTDPQPGVVAEPDEANILKWYYAIRGPSDTPFDGGIYVGKLVFPNEYPMKAPSISMCTPNGRFQINTRICMSMSDFHPESWNPAWAVRTIILGIQSFMASDELTTGGITSPPSEREKFAKLSIPYNQKMFPTLFGGDIVSALKNADSVREKIEQEAKLKSSADNVTSSASNTKFASFLRARQLEATTASSPKIASDDDNKVGSGSSSTAIDSIGTEENNLEGVTTKKKAENKDSTTSSTSGEVLSTEEIEKRRKKNAKKRAKQKAKKMISDTAIEDHPSTDDIITEQENNNNNEVEENS